ncbi:2771_t:CDS:2, partial [Scutellospora calospora]
MKSYNILYNLIAQYVFLISLYLLITSTSSHFNYTESTLNPQFLNRAPVIQNIQTYDDGVTLVHIVIRSTTPTAECTRINRLALSLEQILRIRVIQLNGTVSEINLDLHLDPLNYCLFNIPSTGQAYVPIIIYALQSPFILVNYIKTTNSSDPRTYEEWGMVIDWNGNIKSTIDFGPSYVVRGVWNPI